jgi:predicted nucleic acid-binding protein
MVAVLDSSVLIAAERGQLDLDAFGDKEDGLEYAMAAVTASELLHGVHRAADPERKARREAFVERLLTALPVLPFDRTAARIHARLWAELASKGIVVGAHDLLIAATAMACGYTLVTRDRRSFPKIPGLAPEFW